MAAKDLLKKLTKLNKDISSGKARKDSRKEINDHEALCTVNSSELTKSLMLAFRHYNPIAARDNDIKQTKRKIFKDFSEEVLKDWKKEVQRNKNFEIIKADAKKITFLIGAAAGDSQSLFSKANKIICENLLQKSVYAEHFSLGNQEQQTAEKSRASAHTSKSRRGSLMNFEAAHGGGFSSFEADQALRESSVNAMLDISNLPSEAIAMAQNLKSSFMEEKLEGDSKFTVNKSGKVESRSTITMSIQTSRQNVAEGGPSSGASRKQNNLFKKNAEWLKKTIADTGGKGEEGWGVEGRKSPSVIEGVASSIINTPLKKRLYAKKKARNSTKYKKEIKSGSTPRQETAEKTETKRTSIRGGGITNSMKVAAASRPKGGEKGKGGASDQKDFANQMRHLLKVKRAINQRLPAEVRRNMGKPALTNRTGRFSNSVQVESMIPAAQTLMVKYSYRLNPYETFENTGKKKWPTGYNPKPLIAKSIRGLALGLTDEKLTIRRS